MNRKFAGALVAVSLSCPVLGRADDEAPGLLPATLQVPVPTPPDGRPPAPQPTRPVPARPTTPQPRAPRTLGEVVEPEAGSRTGPGTVPTPTVPSPTATNPTMPPATGSTADTAFSGLGGAMGGAGGGVATPFLNMLGDQAPLARTYQLGRPPVPPVVPPPGRPPTPGQPNPNGNGTIGAVILPSIRGFKIAENQSPQPQDRIYYTFNWFNDVNKAQNERLRAPIYGIQIYREILGVEKTFLEKRASIGLRFPINTLTAGSPIAGFGGTTTDVGDLAVILKYAFWFDPANGRLFSGGLLVNTPTGPNRFAGFPRINSPHYASVQPYLGFIYSFADGNAWAHGFTSIDVPTNPNDVTIWYNDLGVGYYVYRAQEPGRFLTMIAPTVEIHVNTPMNNRDWANLNNPIGTPDVFDFTFGLNVGLGRRSLFSVGYVDPVTGPRPFNGEVMALLNIRF